MCVYMCFKFENKINILTLYFNQDLKPRIEINKSKKKEFGPVKKLYKHGGKNKIKKHLTSFLILIVKVGI